MLRDEVLRRFGRSAALADMRAAGVDLVEIDARRVASELGDVRLANSVMLGAAAGRLPFAPKVLRDEVLRRLGRSAPLAEVNARAFDAGRALAG